MTGFGSAEGMVGDAKAFVEIRTVNHRFFSPNLKLPPAFAKWEGDIRELLRQKISRGHVTLTARLDRAGATSSGIDEPRIAFYAATLRELQKKHGLGGEVDLATLLRLPDVITSPSEIIDPAAGDALAAVVANAADNLIAMRRTEGA
ncbi:MAG TPA: YicC/YloC family endoribonuclease, partial [Gemmatimonadaceae bacterium]|nr:YicC/YloC family endoribonuclease [Gemmatimonadaceae bacterium]